MSERQVPHVESRIADMPIGIRKKKRVSPARRRDRLMLALHDRLRQLNDPVAIQTAAVQVLGEHLGCDWANYSEYDEDYAHAIVRSEYRKDGAPSLAGRHPIEPSGQFIALQRAGRTVAESDMVTSHLVAEDRRASYLALPLRAFVAVPIVKDGRLISSLFVCLKRVHAWRQSELRLIEETAERTSAAVERALAERGMRDSEVRLQLALDATGLGTFAWRVEQDRVEPDERMLSLLGLPAGHAFSFRDVLRKVVHPGDMRCCVDAVARALDPSGSGTFREDIRVRHADGSERWLSVIGQTAFEKDAMPTPTGRRATRFSGIAADITDRKRRECNLAVLDDIANDFARLTTVEDIMQEVAARVCEHMRADSCYLLDVDDAGNSFRANYIWTRGNLRTIVDPLPISSFVDEEFRRAARAGETIVVNDTTTDSRTNAEAYAGFNIASFITVPFVRNGEWRLLFAVCDCRPHTWRPDEIELFRDLSNRLVPRMERARAELAVANDLRDTQLLRDLSVRLISESDTQAFFNAIADAARSITGACGADIHLLGDNGTGRVLVPLTGVDDSMRPPPPFDRFTQSTPLITRDGRTIGVLSTQWSSKSALSERSLRYLDLLARQAAELIERLRSDDALRQSERRLSEELADTKLLQALSAQLIQEQGSESLYHILVDAAMSIMRSSSASLQVLTTERGKSELRLIASRGFSEPAIAAWEWILASAATSCAEASRRGGRVVIPDNEKCEFMKGTPDIAGYRSEGIRASQSTPLVSRSGKTLGMISTHWNDVHEPSERDFRMLDIIARQAADLLERNQVEAALRQNERELKEADRRKDEFLATLAHELRNPLAPLRTSLELIRLAGDRPGAVEDVRTMMEEQLGQLVRLVDDLLDVSRITSGKIRLHRQPSSLVALVNAAVHANQAAFSAGRVALRLAMPNVPVLIDADPTRFVQVVSNVLQNAVKFTDAGGHVTISAAVSEPTPGAAREVVLMITDSGVGITREMLPRVFERFTQDDAAVHRSHAGLGIGLSLARQLIEMHGGSITAHSDGPGLGSSFTIRMPVLDGTLDQRGSTVPADAPRITRRVLVIDDNPAAATSMQRLVTVLGGHCRIAYDGESGLTQVRDFQPDVVILDIGMPGIDGYETCRRIRAEFGPDLLVVALTGWGQERDKRKAWRAGFDVHLTKPADPIALERLLAGVPVEA